MRTDTERVYTLKFVSRLSFAESYEQIENVTIETTECITLPDVIEHFNKLLAVMGFCAKVDVAEEEE